MSKSDDPIPITAQEEKEIARVFNRLCDFHQKTRIKAEISDLKSFLQANKAKAHSQEMAGQSINAEKMEANNITTLDRISELEKELSEIQNKVDKKISCSDVMEITKMLKQKVTRKEVEQMIWEVDENSDQCIDWTEFRLMFNRNIMDKTGLEPSGMYNLAQFLIYDTNLNGFVSVDETMNLLYARYGRAKMESKLKELFGEDMHETGRQGGEITFSSYLKAVEKVQMNMFLNTTKGKIASSKLGFGKKSSSS